ncbi:homocysteine S-methyltransferase family protein [Pseudomonas sp. HR1]|uniref:Homocysteine S-methyltransferase n=2 Tax=Pseudomonas oryzihabitans TaxID=47885 RepID=A0A1G5MM76_9PSED|nr:MULTISPECIES: homocysteine S-methyltransferase family protein [Pseudomonas]MDK4198475.1 homocysteine S-methyltransferase family protein [Pseudomonas sp. HR1]NMY88162.1 homocysteine S-methyltransferase family protein [Pseudomonas psychrotolerans]ONN72754.1 homocysteine S-methyltransferase [Pseudomonas psychrotolerans]QEU05522.1 homocysteine S-methyltransferase family protein [Pseudomonas oryzihabitans]SCZ25658.1 Homocysteine/selenocysteine methylase (S-methylmethionine-dependent) [Pseudomona
MANMNLVLLDGGMGRELQRRGAPFRQPEWSALALSEAPEQVEAVHRAYIEAGAQVITSNSYAVVPFHIGEARFAAEGEALAARAGQLARQAVVASGQPVRVAGSLPPLFGSYRPDLFEPARVDEVLQPLIRGLAPHVDLWLAETQSSLAEVRAIAAGLPGDGKPLWLSFTLKDEDVDETPRLRSGEPVAAAAQLAVELGAGALLFNCSQPEVMAAALDTARATFAAAGVEIPFGAYANAFPPQPEEATANDGLDPLRPDLDPPGYLSFAQDWQARGASLIGGCCGIGPEHIAVLNTRLRG